MAPDQRVSHPIDAHTDVPVVPTTCRFLSRVDEDMGIPIVDHEVCRPGFWQFVYSAQ